MTEEEEEQEEEEKEGGRGGGGGGGGGGVREGGRCGLIGRHRYVSVINILFIFFKMNVMATADKLT